MVGNGIWAETNRRPVGLGREPELHLVRRLIILKVYIHALHTLIVTVLGTGTTVNPGNSSQPHSGGQTFDVFQENRRSLMAACVPVVDMPITI